MNETRLLAEFVANTNYCDLPAQVVEAVRVDILDNLASGFVGSSTHWARMVSHLAKENAPEGSCSIFGRSWTTSPSCAALVNGTMIGSFETDHAYIAGSCHPSACVFPPILAIAERDHLHGTRLLESVALGYELVCRVGRAATRAVEDVAGFHGPGTNAPFGGAAGAGKALGLDEPRVTNALGIAGSSAGGLMEFTKEGAMVKRIHVGRGGQMGLEAALLAAKGFTGPSTVLEGARGFLQVYSPSPRPELLVEELGQRYILMEMTLKAYACHASFHSVMEGISRFRAVNSCDSSQIEDVRISGTKRMVERHSDREPTSVLGAQSSLPFSAAIALCKDIDDPWVYSDEILNDAEVRRLSGVIELVSDEERFGQTGGPVGEVSIAVSGGVHTFTVTDWKGAPTNPYTYDEMAGKFRRYAAPYLQADRIDEVVQSVRRLEEVDDVARLANLLRGALAE